MKTIPLTQGKVAFVDDDLFEELNQFKWCAIKNGKTFYAVRNVSLTNGPQRQRHCRMHREIFRLLNERIPKSVDHKDRDGLNNQRDNLRPATQSEQMKNRGKRINNTSGFIGVCWHKWARKWEAYIRVGGKIKHLGDFTDPFSAAWVRDEFVKALDPEFAVTNNLTDRRQINITVAVERRSKSKVHNARTA